MGNLCLFLLLTINTVQGAKVGNINCCRRNKWKW